MLRIIALIYKLYNAIYYIPLISFTIILHGILLKFINLLKEIFIKTGKASG
jgi:hypothetical protein